MFLSKFWLLSLAMCLNKPYNISVWGFLSSSDEFNRSGLKKAPSDEKLSINSKVTSTGESDTLFLCWLIASFLSDTDGRK